MILTYPLAICLGPVHERISYVVSAPSIGGLARKWI